MNNIKIVPQHNVGKKKLLFIPTINFLLFKKEKRKERERERERERELFQVETCNM